MQKINEAEPLSSTKELLNYSFTPSTLSEGSTIFFYFAQMSKSLNSDKESQAPFPN